MFLKEVSKIYSFMQQSTPFVCSYFRSTADHHGLIPVMYLLTIIAIVPIIVSLNSCYTTEHR